MLAILVFSTILTTALSQEAPVADASGIAPLHQDVALAENVGLEAIFRSLEPEAAAIRSETMTAWSRKQRLEALIETRRADIDAEATLFKDAARDTALRGGASLADAESNAVLGLEIMLGVLTEGLRVGPDPQAEAAPIRTIDTTPTFLDLQRAQTVLEDVLADLEPRAAAIRADPAVDDETRVRRLQALLESHRNEILAFEAAAAAAVRFQMIEQGETPESADGAAAAMSQHMVAGLLREFIEGGDLQAP